MGPDTPVAFEKMIFRNTNAKTGRQVSVTPQNSAMKHLAYGRIILNLSTPAASFSSGDRETALICLSGRANVKTAGQQFEVGQYDAVYIQRDSSIDIWTQGEVDLAEFSADVKVKYPLKLVRYAEASQ